MRPLDDFLPVYEFSERHRLAITAPPEQIDVAIRSVTLAEVPVARFLWALRRLGRPHGDTARSFVDGALERSIVLDDASGEGIVLGL
ncbi:MAG TPA: hypothetical protein VK926_09500, partial [Gaiellaceae bacterium]|nr:hypothetical protein [Gaiellaceae bacterium]